MCSNSEQELMDCNPYSSGKCSGGGMVNSMDFLNKTGIGLMTTKAYPYLAKVS